MSNEEILAYEEEIRMVLNEIANDAAADSWDQACRV